MLSPTRDTVDEPDETVVVDGATTAPGLAVTGTEVEITDGDASVDVTVDDDETASSGVALSVSPDNDVDAADKTVAVTGAASNALGRARWARPR